MVPRDIKFCSSLPLTPGNKVDLKALRSTYWESYIDALNKAEDGTQVPAFVATIRGLQSSLLGIPKINDEDDFFVLGGSPVKSATLISNPREKLGKTVSMRALHQDSRFVDFNAYSNEFAEGTSPRISLSDGEKIRTRQMTSESSPAILQNDLQRTKAVSS
jgi:hypothetical protein